MYKCVYFHNNMLLKTRQTATFTLKIIGLWPLRGVYFNFGD